MLVFYERFIEIKPLEEEIHTLDISSEEKENLLHLSAEIFHHHTLETILNALAEDDRKLFLVAVQENSDITMAQLLKDKVSDYEKVLQDKLTQVRDSIIEEIRKTK